MFPKGNCDNSSSSKVTKYIRRPELFWKSILFMFFLCRYQQLYAETASHISDPGTKMVSLNLNTTKSDPAAATPSRSISSEKGHSATQSSARDIPSWLMPKNDRSNKSVDNSVFNAPLESFDQSSLEDEPPVHK